MNNDQPDIAVNVAEDFDQTIANGTIADALNTLARLVNGEIERCSIIAATTDDDDTVHARVQAYDRLHNTDDDDLRRWVTRAEQAEQKLFTAGEEYAKVYHERYQAEARAEQAETAREQFRTAMQQIVVEVGKVMLAPDPIDRNRLVKIDKIAALFGNGEASV